MPLGAQDERLSISECRKLIVREIDLSDAQMEALRGQMYAFADITAIEYKAKSRNRGTRNANTSGVTAANEAAAA